MVIKFKLNVIYYADPAAKDVNSIGLQHLDHQIINQGVIKIQMDYDPATNKPIIIIYRNPDDSMYMKIDETIQVVVNGKTTLQPKSGTVPANNANHKIEFIRGSDNKVTYIMIDDKQYKVDGMADIMTSVG